jgi:hypothetical protein
MDYLITKEPEKTDYLIEPEPETPAEPQGLMSKAKDTAVSFGIGANSLLQMAGDLYGLATGDMGNVVSQQARENIQYLQQSKSPELRQAEETRRKAIEADEDELGKALSYVRQTVTNPSLLSSALAEQVPNLVGTGGAGAVAKAGAEKVLFKTAADQAAKRLAAKKAAQIGTGAAVAAGAGMQGTDVGSDLYDETVSALDKVTDEQALSIPEIASLVEEKGATLDEAKTAFALMLGREAFALGATISAGAQMLPGGRTIERSFVGRQVGGRLAGAIGGGLGEAASEAVEEGGSRVAANLLARRFEPERPLAKGVGEAVGQAALVGGIPGATFGAASSRPTPQPAPEGETTAGKTGEAPASVATKSTLAGAPEVALESSEGLTPEQFYAAVNIRQARLMGGQPDPEDIRIAGEVPLPKVQIDPEKANQAIEQAQAALQEWADSTANAPQNIRIIFDPELLHNGYGVQGYYSPDGSIFINAAFVAPENVGKIASHEWAHSTLATPEGQQAFADFVQREIPQGELDALAARYGTQDRRVLLEEWIAENQEKAPGVIERIVARIREWLASFNIVDLSDAEVADIMLRTLRQQAEGRIQPDTYEAMQPAEGERFSLSAEPKRISGVMASPSITDINYDRAKRNLTSANQARFKSQISEYAPEAEIFDAVGDWADGSENSVAAIFQDRKSSDELQRLAAQVGLAGDQKAVLWWRTEPEGADAIHEMSWPKTVSMDEARQAMIDVGLENRTLIQTPEGVRGFVFDQGRQNLNKIEALNEHETQPSLESSPAAGDFLGSWTSRAEGRRAYRRVLGSTPQAQAGAGELRSGEVGGVGDRGEPETRFSLTERVAQGRDTVLAAEAQKLKRGETTPAKYARKVEQRMPLRPFDEVPEPATGEDILRGLGNRMAGETLKRELKANPEDIEGQQVEARLDIPSYEDANVWTVTLHNPRERAGAAGKVLAYTPTAILRDVTFTVNETAAMNVAAGARKSTFATMDGTYVPATARSAYEQAVEAKESGDWVEIGMNPIRHSYFYDKADQRPVVSADEVIQVGGLVLGRGVQYGEKPDYKFSLAQTKTPEFQNWFGDSQIVDADGNPQVMYHGTAFRPDPRKPEFPKVTFTRDFTEFRPNERGLIFTSLDPKFSDKFAMEYAGYGGSYKEGARVYPVFVKTENPFDYENPLHIKKLFGDKNELNTLDLTVGIVSRGEVMDGSYAAIEALSRKIKEAGFDGLYVFERGIKNLAVFSSDQLTSATGNVGAFGQRPLTAEERERLGVTEEEAAEGQKRGDIRMSLARGGTRFSLEETRRTRIQPAGFPPDPLGFFSPLQRAIAEMPDRGFADYVATPAVPGRSFPARTIRDKEGNVIKEIPARTEPDKPERVVTAAEQLRSHLEKFNVKKEELEDIRDTGGQTFADWIAQNPNATKEEVAQFVAENQVSVEENVLEPQGKYQIVQDGEVIDMLSFDTEEQAAAYIDQSIQDYTSEFEIDGDQLIDPSGDVVSEITKDEDKDLYYVGYPGAPKTDSRLYYTLNGARRALQQELEGIAFGEIRRYRVQETASATFEEYTLPGGRNYRETVLTLPKGARGSGFFSTHFRDTPNYLAHVRLKDRVTPSGDPVLFVEEIQSDLHQKARDIGYKGLESPQQKAERLKKLEQVRDELELNGTQIDRSDNQIARLQVEINKSRDQGLDAERLNEQLEVEYKINENLSRIRARLMDQADEFSLAANPRGVPNAPFKKTWAEMAFKYVLSEAARKGDQYLAWTTGEQQNRRYPELSAVVRSVGWESRLPGFGADPGEKFLRIRMVNETAPLELIVEPEGTVRPFSRADVRAQRFEGATLTEMVGADLANQIRNKDSGDVFLTEDLVIDEQGMVGFYDEIIPQFAAKYLKKYGVKPEMISVVLRPQRKEPSPLNIPGEEDAEVEVPQSTAKVNAVRITPEMREDFVGRGQPRYSLSATKPRNVSTVGVTREAMGLPLEGPVSKNAVAKALNDLSRGLLRGEEFDDDQIAIAHGVMNAVAEGRSQLLLGDKSGADWYDTDIDTAKKYLRRALPSLKNDTDMVLFTAVMTPTSFGQNPLTNVATAVRIYEAAGDDPWGNLPPRQADGKKGWTARGNAVALGLERINQLVNERGERGAVNWLLKKHPISELRKYNENVSGKAGDLKYGAYIFGPKGGPFFLNMNGIREEMTKDLWWSRTFNRWFGTMEETVRAVDEEGGVEGEKEQEAEQFRIQEVPRNDAERRRMDAIANQAAQRLGLTIEELQATLWYYEQQLWKRLGAKVESYSFRDGALRILEKRGIERPRVRRGDSPNEGRRQAAYLLAAAESRPQAPPDQPAKIEVSGTR